MSLIKDDALHKKNQIRPNSTIVISLVSGACAGGFAKTVIAPLDR